MRTCRQPASRRRMLDRWSGSNGHHFRPHRCGPDLPSRGPGEWRSLTMCFLEQRTSAAPLQSMRMMAKCSGEIRAAGLRRSCCGDGSARRWPGTRCQTDHELSIAWLPTRNRQFIYAVSADGKADKDLDCRWKIGLEHRCYQAVDFMEKMDSPLSFVQGRVLVSTISRLRRARHGTVSRSHRRPECRIRRNRTRVEFPLQRSPRIGSIPRLVLKPSRRSGDARES